MESLKVFRLDSPLPNGLPAASCSGKIWLPAAWFSGKILLPAACCSSKIRLPAAKCSRELHLPDARCSGNFYKNHWLDSPLHHAMESWLPAAKCSSEMWLPVACCSGEIWLPAVWCSGESNFNSNNSMNLKPNLKKIRIWIRVQGEHFWWGKK